MVDIARRAGYALGYNPLTYADPVGEEVVRRLDGDVTITWPDGLTLRIAKSESGPLLRFITAVYTYRMSRKGLIWGTKKKGLDIAGDTAPRPATPTITKE